ncbi:MAG: hypothetical protein JW812_00445 [Alphaproteobacteria bacterium]|nr:hypothetical protein [Alphaproteobacteria bacterium]MBN2780105.1 hypothetical protein [Alphaproteobacteria bacterium]
MKLIKIIVILCLSWMAQAQEETKMILPHLGVIIKCTKVTHQDGVTKGYIGAAVMAVAYDTTAFRPDNVIEQITYRSGNIRFIEDPETGDSIIEMLQPRMLHGSVIRFYPPTYNPTAFRVIGRTQKGVRLKKYYEIIQEE